MFPSPQKGSIWQRLSHPSPSAVPPSSHCSPASTELSPHIPKEVLSQLLSQVSSLTKFPSSHASIPSSCGPPLPAPFGCCTILSPQNVKVQIFIHPSLLFWFPSSQCSPLFKTPFPQFAIKLPVILIWSIKIVSRLSNPSSRNLISIAVFSAPGKSKLAKFQPG